MEGQGMSEVHPKLFISYSWTNPDHEEWVIKLASELVDSGVDVILDKWDLKEGNDAHAFMERMVADSEIKKVAIICDLGYAKKANERRGGVGTETQIISPEIYEKQDQNKFVAVIAERDAEGKPYAPIYYRSKVYIDLSSEELYGKNFEQLLRWIYDKPLYIKPELGKVPAFLSDTPTTSLGTTAKFRRALEAIHNNKPYCSGALTEYFDTFVENLERFRIVEKQGELDDQIVGSIEQFLPYRNEAVEIFIALAVYKNTEDTHQRLHHFFEQLIPYMHRTETMVQCSDLDFDNFKFIVHELFLYAIAALIKYECFDAVSYLLRKRYYFAKVGGKSKMISFAGMREHTKSLEYRNRRLKLNRISVRGDILASRAFSGLNFGLIAQADFILFIRDCIESLMYNQNQSWWPEVRVYLDEYGGALEIFTRSESSEYFQKIYGMLGISSKKGLDDLVTNVMQGKLRIPEFGCYGTTDITYFLGYDKLATRT
jgi:hypothetical protein